MLHNNPISAAQIAFCSLFVLLLASYCRGNPIDEGERSSTYEVVEFTVRISEAGEEYYEKIEVDTKKQTELFEVPAHPGVDRSDALHDFKQKVTMWRSPDSNACYLLPLLKSQPSPKKLIRFMRMAEQKNITESRRSDSTWIVKGKLNDRSFLSDDLMQFCADYPIYTVKIAKDSLVTTSVETKEVSKRERIRRSCGMKCKCPGGMDMNEAFNYCVKPTLKCKVQTTTCYKYVICPVGGQGEPPPPRVVLTSQMHNSRTDGCWEDHIYSNIICCEYICR